MLYNRSTSVVCNSFLLRLYYCHPRFNNQNNCFWTRYHWNESCCQGWSWALLTPLKESYLTYLRHSIRSKPKILRLKLLHSFSPSEIALRWIVRFSLISFCSLQYIYSVAELLAEICKWAGKRHRFDWPLSFPSPTSESRIQHLY